AVAEAVGEGAGDRGDDHRRRGPGKDAQAGLEGRVAERGLEELRHQEKGAEEAGVHEEAYAVGAGESAAAEEAEGAHGEAGATLPGKESTDKSNAGDEGADDLGAAPAAVVRPDETPCEAKEAGSREQDAGDVELGAGTKALAELRCGE